MSYHEHLIGSIEHGATKRKRPSQESFTEEIAWTAARCNRLLRTITQRTSALRRLLDTCTSNDSNAVKKDPLRERRPDEHWSTTDPVWLPDGKRKATYRTYTAKAKLEKDTTQTRPPNVKISALAFPSPFVRRIGSNDPSDQSGSPRPRPVVRERPPPPRRSRQLPIKPGSPAQEAEQGLVTAFSNLLATTSSSEPAQAKGSRSLMSMCLRQVPAYIELNEEFESSDNFTTEIFSYLEQYGLRDDGGWSGLREVVRGQAVHLIRAAILDGLVSVDAMQKLLDTCGAQNAILEGQDIFQTWLGTTAVLSSIHTTKLDSFGYDHSCRDSTFRTMRLVGSQDHAKLGIFCKRSGFWNALLRSLAGISGHEAADLLAQCVRLAIEQDEQAPGITIGVKELVLKLTTMAASAFLLGRQDVFICRTISRLAADAAFSILETDDSASISTDIHSLAPLLLDSALLLCGIAPDSQSASTTMTLATLERLSTWAHDSSQSKRDNFADSVVEAILDLEKHLRQPLTGPLVERILEMPTAPPLFQRVALAALTAKRQSSEHDEDERQYHDLLKRLTASKESRPKTPRTPFRKNTNAGYRWEDGICEWVATTPFTAATSFIESFNDESMASVVDTPPTSTSIGATPNKENQDPVEKKDVVAEKLVLRPPPCAMPEQSPDVLAMTPQLKRSAESPSIPAQKRARLSRTSSTISVENGRRGGRISGSSLYSDVDESEDELGF